MAVYVSHEVWWFLDTAILYFGWKYIKPYHD